MPVLQFSLATLSGLINGNQADSGGKGGDSPGKKSGDQFSSLLDVVGNIGDAAQLAASNKKDDTKDPVAVEVHSAQPFRDPLDKTVQKVVSNKTDNKKDDSAQSAARAKNNDDDKNTAPASDKTPAKPVLKAADNSNKTDKSDDKVSVSASTNSSDDETTDELKEKIAAHADSLSDLLNIIAQLLASTGASSASFTVNTQTQITVASSGDNLTVGDGSQKNADLPAIFADLKNVLTQLQQFLQGANSGDAQNANNVLLTPQQNATLNSINNALQSDLNALKNLLPQGLSGDDNNSLQALAMPASQVQDANGNAPQLNAQNADVKKLLADDISLIKEALKKFRDDRVTDSAQGDNNAPKIPVKPLITTATNSVDPLLTPNDKKQDAASDAAPIVVQAVSIAGSQQAASQQTNTQQNNTSALPAAASLPTVTSSDSGSSSNFSDSSGQNGNSQQQFTISGVSAQATRASGAAATSQFAGMLNRADQTPVTEQVVFHVKTMAGSGNSKITIQLHPEDLGKLDITLDVDAKGKTGVTITADNKHALDLLQRDSSGLQKALADAGLKTDAGSLSFNLRGGEKEGQGHNGYQASSQYQKSQPDEIPEEVNMASLAAVTRSYTVNIPDGLDIKI